MNTNFELKQLNNKDYLEARKLKVRAKCEKLLAALPSFVKDFYLSREGTNEDLTRLAYLKDLKEFFEYEAKILNIKPDEIDIELFEKLTAEDIDIYKIHLLMRNKHATAKRKLASIASFYKFLCIKKGIKNNPTLKIDWPKTEEPNIIWLDGAQIESILSGILANDKQIYYVDDDGNYKISSDSKNQGKNARIKGNFVNNQSKYKVDDISELTKKRREKTKLRDYAMFALFLGTGMRISELISVNAEDVNFRTNTIDIIGKGNRKRTVSFNETVKNALLDYLNKPNGRSALRTKNMTSNALFLASGGNRISAGAVESNVKELVRTYYPYTDTDRDEITGIISSDRFRDKFSPHKLRSTFATRVLKQSGGNLKLTANLSGNSVEVAAKHYAAIKKEEELSFNKEQSLTDF